MQKRRYLLKMYAQDGTTLVKNIPSGSISDIPTFTSRINSIPGPCTIKLTGDDFTFQSFDEGTTVKDMNIAKLYKMDEDNQLGRVIFKGFVSQYSPYYRKGDQGVQLTLLHVASLLGFSYYKNGTSYTVTHTNADPET